MAGFYAATCGLGSQNRTEACKSIVSATNRKICALVWKTAGTRLGSSCRPSPNADHLLDVLNAYMPTLNRPVTLVVVSKTSPTAMGSNTWLVSMQGPDGLPAQPVGAMEHWPNSTESDNTTLWAYRLVVPGSRLLLVSFKTGCAPGGAFRARHCFRCMCLHM